MTGNRTAWHVEAMREEPKRVVVVVNRAKDVGEEMLQNNGTDTDFVIQCTMGRIVTKSSHRPVIMLVLRFHRPYELPIIHEALIHIFTHARSNIIEKISEMMNKSLLLERRQTH